MTNQQTRPKVLAVERILSTASELFYKQGYRATGINEIIKSSGVAKATLYNHFPAKDDLCMAYLTGMSETLINYFELAIDSAEGTVERFLAVVASLEPWLIETEFRGCVFLNIAAEIPDYNNPLRKPGTEIYTAIHKRVAVLCTELIASDPQQYSHLNPTELSNQYMLIFTGAIALSELYNSTSPANDALKAIYRLIDEAPK